MHLEGLGALKEEGCDIITQTASQLLLLIMNRLLLNATLTWLIATENRTLAYDGWNAKDWNRK